MPEFKRVIKFIDLKDGEVRGFKIGDEKIALYKLGDEIFATTDVCTHAQCEISENFFVEGGEVECTCHGSRFEIKTGENTVPPAAEPLKTYKTKIAGEDVLVEV